MKKKLTTLLIVMLTAVVTISASFDYRFDLLSFEPLHQEYTADRDRAGLDFQWLWVDDMPEGVWQNGLYYEFKPFGGGEGQATDGFDEAPWMAMIHLGETLGLARSTFTFDHWLSPVSFDFSFQGSMVLGMEGGMADMIGYDGVFFYGASASIADRFSLRIGLHHYCTHYGDGTLKLQRSISIVGAVMMQSYPQGEPVCNGSGCSIEEDSIVSDHICHSTFHSQYHGALEGEVEGNRGKPVVECECTPCKSQCLTKMDHCHPWSFIEAIGCLAFSSTKWLELVIQSILPNAFRHVIHPEPLEIETCTVPVSGVLLM